MPIPSNLTLVILDNFHELNSIPEVRILFSNLLHLKSLGYGKYFDKSFIPYDSLDYISRYYMLCAENLVPLSCIRMLSFNKASFHHQKIPLIKFAQDSNSDRHLDFMNSFLNQGDCLYSGNFTVHPEFRNSEFIELSKTLVSASTYMEIISNKYRAVFAAATPRMKTDIAMAKWGYLDIQDSLGQLPNLHKFEANNEEIKLMIMPESSLDGKRSMSILEEIIEKKIIFSEEFLINKAKVA